MAVPEALVAFVQSALAQGIPRARIEETLRAAGWEPRQVAAALAAFADGDFPIPVPRPAPNLSARDAFLYLLLFTTLYLSAFNLGRLLLQFVQMAVPDPAAPPYTTGSWTASQLRGAVAGLIVAFPLFLWLSAFTAREIERDPTKRGSRVRRWLTYLTLLLAAAVIIADLIAFLDDLLGGALALRFVLKVLVVGGIAAGIFVYYLGELRADERAAP